jgi:uncharacterized protein YndB with AHSA1/START domain
MSEATASKSGQRRVITLERRYRASLEDVWRLWTTKEGIESWWGPDGFAVTVDHLDLRAGGELRYTMAAVAPEMIEFMQQDGMLVETSLTLVFTEVESLRRLSYTALADFIPHIEPYEMATTVSLEQEGGEVRMVLAFDAMHDEAWTERAVLGYENELERMAKLLQSAA